MMNKLTIVFCLILCAAFCGNYQTVSAQNGADKILVAGKSPLKQSEVDKIIEFYQWAFETEFTADERERYQAFVVESFRQDAAESRKSADVLIKVLAQMRAKDAETQAKLRRMFNEDFVKDLRAANDEGSRLLLNIYERGQSRGIGSGGGNSSESNETTDSNDSYETVKKAKVGNLSTIAGTWVSGNTGSMTTTNSGVYLGGNASRHTYQFRAERHGRIHGNHEHYDRRLPDADFQNRDRQSEPERRPADHQLAACPLQPRRFVQPVEKL